VVYDKCFSPVNVIRNFHNNQLQNNREGKQKNERSAGQSQTLAMLKTYINKKGLGLNDRLFRTQSDTVAKNLQKNEE